MADELKLDVIVDDHGGVQKLADVDAGVNRVVASAKAGTPSLDDLNAQFADMDGLLARLRASTPAAAVGAGQLSAILGGAAVTAATLFAVGLRNAGLEADKFVAIGERLTAPAARIQAITVAASENHVTVDQMTGALGRFQQRLATGAIDDELRDIGIELAAFKQLNVADQFLQITDTIGGMEEPLDRVNARVKVLGTGSEEMAGLMKRSFRESTDAVISMRDETITALDEVTDHFSHTWTRIKGIATIGAGEAAIGFLNLMGRSAWQEAGRSRTNPSVGSSGGGPESLPAMNTDAAWAKGEGERMNAEIRAQIELTKELRGSWAATIEMIRLYGTDAPAAITIVDERLTQIKTAQAIIEDGWGNWSDVLDTRVAASVDNITGKLQNAIILNAQLAGGAGQERDRLMAEFANPANPNESQFDREFNRIDQRFKADMAKVDQTDRSTAIAAENALLERMNLEILKLQQTWDGATSKVTDHSKAVAQVGASYETAFRPAGGTAMPGGLVAPTAEQVANGRYFGPVTPNGEPDLARMGGAAPVTNNNFTFNAQGADAPGSLDGLARKVADLIDQRSAERGARVSR